MRPNLGAHLRAGASSDWFRKRPFDRNMLARLPQSGPETIGKSQPVQARRGAIDVTVPVHYKV